MVKVSVSELKARLSEHIRRVKSGEEDLAVSDTEADEMEEHLRGLGYIK